MEHRIGAFRSESKHECSLSVCGGQSVPHSWSWSQGIGAVDLNHLSEGPMG